MASVNYPSLMSVVFLLKCTDFKLTPSRVVPIPMEFWEFPIFPEFICIPSYAQC